MAATLTADDVRALWNRETLRIGDVTADDVFAVSIEIDTDDNGQPSAEDLQVVADQLNGVGASTGLAGW
jgi:hypothetical protein